MTSLWCNVSVNVDANNSWSCLLISAPKVHWRVQPTAARQSGRLNKMHGALSALHVNASTRTVRKCLKRNNGHLILQTRMAWRYRSVWEATHEAILKPSSEAQNRFWIRNRTGEDMGQFSADPINTRNSAIADKPRDAFKGKSRSPNMVPFHTWGMVSYQCQNDTYSDIRLQKMPWPWNLGQRSLKVIESDTVRQNMYGFPLMSGRYSTSKMQWHWKPN